MSFGENLKLLRTKQSLSQRQLGEMIGVTDVAIGYWERDIKQPKLDAIVSLAKALRVSANTLVGCSCADSDSSLLSKDAISLAKDFSLLDTYGKKSVRAVCDSELFRINSAKQKNTTMTTKQKKRYIPIYLSPPAAGFGSPLEGSDFEMMIADDSVPFDADYAVRVSGISMEPYIEDGETVFVRETEDFRIGDVGIFCVDGEMFCKQYYRDDKGNVTLLSANPDMIKANVYISRHSGSSIRACGIVLGKKVPLPSYDY